ncbi:unnamed protein product [Mesocestoides corti]|uniref:Uncharacterized protein n=1 Tax=Mesocestoides corti TaxID=53468 RepID=A0A3P6HCF2_MESCO|nr:unnamed protein product [Mesocestoides corti]
MARAATMPSQDFTPPSFGIEYTKKPSLVDRSKPSAGGEKSLKASTPPPPQPQPQANGPARLFTTESFMRRYGDERFPPQQRTAHSPGPRRALGATRQARPGSVFIPRRSPISSAPPEQWPVKPPDTTATTPTKTTNTTNSRPRFFSRSDPPEVQPSQEQVSLYEPFSENGLSRQMRSTTPVNTTTAPLPVPNPSSQPQQPIAYSAPSFIHHQQQQQQPNQPAFAVIAQDPSALQALLSGDLGGRTYIIQPLQQPYLIPQYQAAPASYPPFAVSQAPLPPPLTFTQPPPALQHQQPVTVPQQPPTLHVSAPPEQLQPPQLPAWQVPVYPATQQTVSPAATESRAVFVDVQTSAPTLRETTPQPASEAPVTSTGNRPQAAVPVRPPSKTVQSILKQIGPQHSQQHEAHRVSLREPQKLGTPTFLQPVKQPPRLTASRENTPIPTKGSPLCEYVEKLKLAPVRANRRALLSNTTKSKSMPESDNLRAISMAMEDNSVMSVIDRARLWQEERRLEEVGRSKSGFVDRDLIACGDELVPVEERVRAFNTGQIVEENEAAKRKLNEEFEEERNRRIREQLFSSEAKPSTPIQLSCRAVVNRPKESQPLSPKVLLGDPLTKLSVKEKSSLFARRSGGGRPMKSDRGTIQRRKTQPVTLDDIARVNQSILEGGGVVHPDSPIGSFREEDLEIGSCLSSPAASVISEFSEIAHAQSPTKPRGLRIF